MASRRSSRTLLMFGRSFLPRTKNTIANAIRPMTSSGISGIRGFWDSSSAAICSKGEITSVPSVEFSRRPRPSGRRVDEAHDQTDQCERLTEHEAEDLVLADEAGGLGLAGQ